MNIQFCISGQIKLKNEVSDNVLEVADFITTITNKINQEELELDAPIQIGAHIDLLYFRKVLEFTKEEIKFMDNENIRFFKISEIYIRGADSLLFIHNQF